MHWLDIIQERETGALGVQKKAKSKGKGSKSGMEWCGKNGVREEERKKKINART